MRLLETVYKRRLHGANLGGLFLVGQGKAVGEGAAEAGGLINFVPAVHGNEVRELVSYVDVADGRRLRRLGLTLGLQEGDDLLQVLHLLRRDDLVRESLRGSEDLLLLAEILFGLGEQAKVDGLLDLGCRSLGSLGGVGSIAAADRNKHATEGQDGGHDDDNVALEVHLIPLFGDLYCFGGPAELLEYL